MLKLLAAPNPVATVRLMAERGVLGHAVPAEFNIGRLRELIQIEPLANVPQDAVRRLGALLQTDETGMLRVAERWRLSNADRDRLLAIAAPGPKPDPSWSDRERRVLIYRMAPAPGRIAF